MMLWHTASTWKVLSRKCVGRAMGNSGIAYAKTKSDVVAKAEKCWGLVFPPQPPSPLIPHRGPQADGTYVERPKKIVKREETSELS